MQKGRHSFFATTVAVEATSVQGHRKSRAMWRATDRSLPQRNTSPPILLSEKKQKLRTTNPTFLRILVMSPQKSPRVDLISTRWFRYWEVIDPSTANQTHWLCLQFSGYKIRTQNRVKFTILLSIRTGAHGMTVKSIRTRAAEDNDKMHGSSPDRTVLAQHGPERINNSTQHPVVVVMIDVCVGARGLFSLHPCRKTQRTRTQDTPKRQHTTNEIHKCQ